MTWLPPDYTKPRRPAGCRVLLARLALVLALMALAAAVWRMAR